MKKRGVFMYITPRSTRQKGFTYVEVIIAFGILLMVFAPLMAGFAAAARNQLHAAEFYDGGLHADRLLLYADGLLTISGGAEHTSGSAVIEQTGLSSDFDTEYETDRFSYRMIVYEISGGIIATGGTVIFTGGEPVAPVTPEDIIFGTDNNNLFETGSFLLTAEVYDKNAVLIKRAIKLSRWEGS
jgi:type II secretory pathway pseudopilin PulG